MEDFIKLMGSYISELQSIINQDKDKKLIISEFSYKLEKIPNNILERNNAMKKYIEIYKKTCSILKEDKVFKWDREKGSYEETKGYEIDKGILQSMIFGLAGGAFRYSPDKNEILAQFYHDLFNGLDLSYECKSPEIDREIKRLCP